MMSHAGRKPTGPALAQHLEGSERAKQRLEMILATIAGQMTIDQASRCLGIKAAMFYRLRTEVLEAGLASLEPRPMGRPPHTPTAEELRCAELNQEVEQLRVGVEARRSARRGGSRAATRDPGRPAGEKNDPRQPRESPQQETPPEPPQDQVTANNELVMNVQVTNSNHRIASRSRRTEGFARQAPRRVVEEAVRCRAATLAATS